MMEPGLTIEQRLAALEAKADARSMILSFLIIIGLVLYMLFVGGHLRFAMGGSR